MALYPCSTTTNEQGRELAQHGTAFFPVACYHDDLSREPVPWHWHPEFELFTVSEGAAAVAAGTERFIVRPGEGIFINSGVLHAVWDHEKSGCRLHSAVFHPRLVGGSADSIFWQNYVGPLAGNSSLKSLHFGNRSKWHRESQKIGAQCGFLDASYFTKTFREWKGCTPSEYRKKGISQGSGGGELCGKNLK